MLTEFLNMFFKRDKNEKTKITVEDILTEKRKQEIDKIWNNLDRMSGYGQSLIIVNTQENDLAMALAHSKQSIVKQFEYFLQLNKKLKVVSLMKQYENTSEEDGYRMKSYIIDIHNERFRKEKLIK